MSSLKKLTKLSKTDFSITWCEENIAVAKTKATGAKGVLHKSNIVVQFFQYGLAYLGKESKTSDIIVRTSEQDVMNFL